MKMSNSQANTILYELYNLSIPEGTGIATYSENLINSSTNIGFSCSGLFSSYRNISYKNSELAKLQFFDARNKPGKTIIDEKISKLQLFPHWLLGDPLGLSTVEINTSSVVLEPRKRNLFDQLDKIYVANNLMDRSRLHFNRYKQPLSIKVNTTPKIFHATQLIPIKINNSINIYTIHDLIPYHTPQYTLDDKKYYYESLLSIIHNSDYIITVSEASRNEIIKLSGSDSSKIINTYQSVSFPKNLLEFPSNEMRAFVENSYNLESGNYFFYYGGFDPRKNLKGVIDGYLASNSKSKLVIAGGLGWEYENDLKRIKESKIGAKKITQDRIVEDERIIQLSYLSLFQLFSLLKNSKALIYPSFYEGFGLPAVEAMMLGVPVITSNASSLPEITNGSALLVSPYDIRDISNAIKQIEHSDDLRKELIFKGLRRYQEFTPEAYQKRLLNAYDMIMSKENSR